MQFKDIIGHEDIKRRLIQTVRESRVSHAQLFHGPEGSGKLALAMAYAQFINCRNKQHFGGTDDELADSCGTCPSCVKYEKLAHPDLHFIYPVATNKEVKKDPVSKDFLSTWRQVLLENDLRLTLNEWHRAIQIDRKQGIINAQECSEILRTLSYTSYESEYKVMIIWMVERLYHAAAPKILKILEEPPDKTLFILVTTNPDKIIPTILSRTQMVRIPRYSDSDIHRLLVTRTDCSDKEAETIVPLADGNYTLAVRLFQKESAEASDFELFTRWMRHCYTNKYDELLEFVAEVSRENRERLKNLLAYGVRMIRNSLVVNYDIPKLARMNQEEKEFLVKFRHFITPENVVELAKDFEEAQIQIERNANPSILFTDLSLNIGLQLHKARLDGGKA